MERLDVRLTKQPFIEGLATPGLGQAKTDMTDSWEEFTVNYVSYSPPD